MRFRHRDGTVVHLAYCTNVHPTQDLEALLRQVRQFGGGVRERLGVDRLGLGLWLPAPVAAQLTQSGVEPLRAALADNGLETVTLNAFPYAGFQDQQVKKAVYHPDWCEPERLAYTVNCATVLAELLPDDVARGSISSLPLAWRTPWDAERQARAAHQLDELAEALGGIEERTERTIRVGFEPEPGCVVETAADAAEHLAGVDVRRLGVCLDACHLAVQFEDPQEAVARVGAAELPVVKAQASAALHANEPAQKSTRAALGAYAEDRFLHQTRERDSDEVHGRDDLPEALGGSRPLDGRAPWRIHFHIPLHRPPAEPLAGTHDELRRTLEVLVGGETAMTDHIEVETYTWSVLPVGYRPDQTDDLVDGLAAEVRWAADELTKLGLEEL